MPTLLAAPAPAMTDTTPNTVGQPYSEVPPPQWRPPGAEGGSGSGSHLVPADAMDGTRALEALVWSQGRPAVAAERLGLQDADSLLAAIVLDDSLQDRLRSVMRAFAMLRLLGVAERMEDTLMERVDQLDAPAAARLFTQILTLVDQMTRGANSAGAAAGANSDPREALLKALPDNVRRALRVVQGGEAADSIYDAPGDSDDSEQAS